MNNHVNLSSTAFVVDYDATTAEVIPFNNCSVSLQYIFVEHIVYLYFLSPLCLIGILLNIFNLIVFSDRSFKNLTFKYLRLIASVDCLTCTLVFIYCITYYTRPLTFNDKYFRVWYLMHIYFPLANITAGFNVLLTLTVTIERLVSIRWPMKKQRLFNPNRVLITLIICFLFPILANSVNFLVYQIDECNDLSLTSIAKTKTYEYFGMCKEILLRFIPICILICANCLLLSTVRAANQKFRPPKASLPSPTKAKYFPHPSTNGYDTTPITQDTADPQSQTENHVLNESTVSTSTLSGKTSLPTTSLSRMLLRKQQHERQLTIMLVWLSTLYLCGQIPMLFAYPNFVFKDTSQPSYKYYAILVNFLELTTYIADFFIYIMFTTQFQRVFRTKVKQIFACFPGNS